MAHYLIAALEVLARYFRMASTFALLLLAIRFAWLSSAQLMQETETKFRRAAPMKAPDERNAQLNQDDKSPVGQNAHRPSLEELKKQLAPEQLMTAEPKGPVLRKRRLLVDIGPERSVIYVDGKKVGRVPFGGEVACVDGDIVQVQVLPPSGAPLSRQIRCGGDTLLTKDP